MRYFTDDVLTLGFLDEYEARLYFEKPCREVVGTGVKFTVSVTAPNHTTTPACEIIKNDISISDGFPVWAWTEGAEMSLPYYVLSKEVKYAI